MRMSWCTVISKEASLQQFIMDSKAFHMQKVMTVYREELLVRPSVMLSVTDCPCQIVVGLLG